MLLFKKNLAYALADGILQAVTLAGVTSGQISSRKMFTNP
jgi:hypothetical protein